MLVIFRLLLIFIVMVTRKICVAAVIVVLAIELLIGSILVFALGPDLVQSNVKKVQNTCFSISF